MADEARGLTDGAPAPARASACLPSPAPQRYATEPAAPAKARGADGCWSVVGVAFTAALATAVLVIVAVTLKQARPAG